LVNGQAGGTLEPNGAKMIYTQSAYDDKANGQVFIEICLWIIVFGLIVLALHLEIQKEDQRYRRMLSEALQAK
jgi:hypothetical protein